MSVADDFVIHSHFSTGVGATAGATKASAGGAAGGHRSVPRHRVAEVRKQQGVSVRSAARRMGVSMEQVRVEERPDSDLRLSDLARWQQALDVPMVDLLREDQSPLSAPIMGRAKWLRLMKTIKALVELNASPSATRMAQMLEQQVTELMPELAEVGAWHSVGQRRTQDEVGRIAEEVVSTNFARDGLG